MKYRGRFEIVDAMQFTEEMKDRVFNWITCNCYAEFDENSNPILEIETSEGLVTVHLGEYIIKISQSVYHISGAGAFKAAYEEVEEE